MLDGTRTSVINPTEFATADEAAIKNGTLYLVDANGEIAFQEGLSGLDWSGAVGKENQQLRRTARRLSKLRLRMFMLTIHTKYISRLVTKSQQQQ